MQLIQAENVRGVITMNEEYETKFFCNSAEVKCARVCEDFSQYIKCG